MLYFQEEYIEPLPTRSHNPNPYAQQPPQQYQPPPQQQVRLASHVERMLFYPLVFKLQLDRFLSLLCPSQ